MKKGIKTTEFKQWDPENLLEYYGVNKSRAEKSREYALKLFDGLFVSHGLGQEERKLLGLAAFLKNAGNSILPEERARMNREILLMHPIKKLMPHEILMLALIAELQDPDMTEKRLILTFKDIHAKLPPELQNKALMLSAIMSIADLFESSKTQPGKSRQLKNTLEIEIIGTVTEKAAKKFEAKSKLWKSLSGSKLLFSQTADEEKVPIDEEKSIIKEEESKTKEEESGITVSRHQCLFRMGRGTFSSCRTPAQAQDRSQGNALYP